MTFYDNFKNLCLERGKSPSGVATELKISSGTVSNWKATGRKPSSQILQKIATYFGVSTDYLLHGGEESPKAFVTYDPDVEIFECIEMLKDERIRRLLLKLKRASAEDLSKVIGMIDVLGIGGEVDG